MSVEIVDVSSCKRNLVVEVPTEEVDGEINRLAQKYAERAKVPGFRPGKVPLGIIKQRFSAELRTDATQDLINRYWKNALSEHHLHPLAQPVVEQVDAEPGSSLRFTLSFEVLPPLEIKDYKGVSVRLPEPEVNREDVDRVLENLREQSAQLVPVEEGEIRDGHVVTLNIDGEFENAGKPLHEEDVVCVVGDPQTNETFSANLRGARLADQRNFEVSYPTDYHRKRFAGKTVHYRILVKDIKEKHLAELNDEFAQDVAGQQSLEELRAKVREDLITKAELGAEKNAKKAVLDQIVQRHSFEAPECLIRDELEDHARRIGARLAQQGIDVNKTSIDWRKIFEEERPHAEQAVRRMLVLNAISQQENLDVSEEELEQEFRSLAEAGKKSAAALRAQVEKDQRIQGFKEHLRRKKALDFIYRNANISRG